MQEPLMYALVEYFGRTPVALVCAYLFGSQATGNAHAQSDVDIAVLLSPAAAAGLTGPLTTIRGDLERLLHRPVDIVDLRTASPDLIRRILRDGALVAERDSGARVQFEVQARNQYFDLLPHLRRYRNGEAA